MKKSILIALFAALCFNINLAHADINATGAENFVKKMTDEGIEDIINAKEGSGQKGKVCRKKKVRQRKQGNTGN